MRFFTLAACGFLLILAASAQSNRGYYRTPTVYGDAIVFASEGDLWSVGVQGGVARRLTSHPGEERDPGFSPDGKTLAFSADYEGPTEVYTMPATGGLPTRRTFQGGATAAGWTPDGRLLIATRRFAGLPDMQLVALRLDGRSEVVPLSQAAQGSYEPQGRTLFFTRVPFQGSEAKRYQGGTAQKLWKYTAGAPEAVPLTADYNGTSKNAMVWQGRVYFVSDRDGTMNLWSMNEAGKDLRQHTRQQGWDIRSASLQNGRIVYQMGADLRLYEIGSGQDRAVPIELSSDFDHLREHWVKPTLANVTSAHLSPNGDRIVLTARGRSFVAPAKQGRFVELTGAKPGRFREARFWPDGQSVLALSTESGEVELWKMPANGVGPGQQLTRDAKVLRWDGIASPNGKFVVHQDKDNQLWLLDVATQQNTRVGIADDALRSSSPQFDEVRWSPDSRWFLWHREPSNGLSQVVLYDTTTQKQTPLTTNRYDNHGAGWSSDGKWIYFLSDRALKTAVPSPWGPRQPDPYFDKSVKIYAIALNKGQRFPFDPADEFHPDKPAPPPTAPGTPAPPPTPPQAPTNIDLDGIAARLYEVPLPPGNYSQLEVAGNRLCWLEQPANEPGKRALACVDIQNKGDKPEVLLEGVREFEASADGKKLLARKENELLVIDSTLKAIALKDAKALADSQVNLKDWTFSVLPTAEYKEAFLDAWRLHRDYFYDRKMHGVNWNLMRDKYGEIIGRVRSREELNDLLAYLVSELSALHTFVRGGDVRRGPDQIPLSYLGARLQRDEAAGGYRIEHIYASDPDRPDRRSPLADPNVAAKSGDVLLSVNGRPTLSVLDVNELLRNQAGKQVLLRLQSPGEASPREAVAKPIGTMQEADLRYLEWEYTRRLQVEKEGAGALGYVHLRAMGPNDIDQWVEEYSPVFTRQGLIIDVRHNNGGNIDSWILGKLLRKAWMYWQPRVGAASWNMQQAFRGHLVVLVDERTASDGEAFAEGFRRLGLGKVIGTRTWGGEIWLTSSNRLADEGIASAAELGVYGPEKQWLIEGHGVEPDVVVDNLPHATFLGQDAQLAAAIAHLQQLIKQKPVTLPAVPDYPDKTWREPVPSSNRRAAVQ